MKKGLILLNLGTPLNPSVKAVRSYLREFLMDPFVLDMPTFFRWLLVNGIIAPFRAPKSAHAYQSIWTSEGSPLLVFTKRFLQKMKQKISGEWVVETGMTYGSPSFQEALHNVLKQGVDEIYVVPLFPQWATAAAGAAIFSFDKILKQSGFNGKVRILRDYHKSPSYIEALSEQVKAYELSLQNSSNPLKQHYLLSYHSLPERQVLKDQAGSVSVGGRGSLACAPNVQCEFTDKCCIDQNKDCASTCYRAQCYKTSELLAQKLGWKKDIDYTVSFQSRLGRAKWIQPYTADMLANLGKQGVEHLTVMCPGFSVDCLETLEEINIGGREIFLSSGGKSFTMLPCLNDSDIWVEKFIKMMDEPNLPWI